jgi:hypothetical protein
MPGSAPQEQSSESESETREIEMYAQEFVKAEIDYRRQAARKGRDAENLRAARAAHPSMWRRLRSRSD